MTVRYKWYFHAFHATFILNHVTQSSATLTKKRTRHHFWRMQVHWFKCQV